MFGTGGKDKGVISMTDREKQRNRAPLRVVEAYWHGLCNGTDVPLRSEVDPRGMENALENAFLLERISPTHGKIRVAGSHLSDLMGMQVAGMPLSSLIAPEDRDAFGKAVGQLFADPAVIRIKLKAEGGFGKPAMEAEMIILPLRSDFGEVTRALGALISDGRIGRTPRRFRVSSVDVETVPKAGALAPSAADLPDSTPTKITDHMKDEPLMPPAPLRKLFNTDTQAGKDTDASELPARGHLRLIVSND